MDNDNSKSALILGNVNHGAIETALKSHGCVSKNKILHSSPKNWESIVRILEENDPNISLVLVKFTEYTLFLFSLPEYKSVGDKILELITPKKHVIFVYNENLFGQFSAFDNSPELYNLEQDDSFADLLDGNLEEREEILHALNEQRRNQFKMPVEDWCTRYSCKKPLDDIRTDFVEFLEKLQDLKLNIVGYRTIHDIAVYATSFVERTLEGLLLRIYIPNEKIWSNEIEKTLSLFKDYVSTLTENKIQLIQNRTDNGISYSFLSVDESITSKDLPQIFTEFTTFLDICSKNPSEAIKLINNPDIPTHKANQILKRYVKEAQRLLLDINHERESKILSIKHRLESELIDVASQNEINELTSNILPTIQKASDILNGDSIVGQFLESDSNRVVNINPQYIQTVNGIVAAEISGNINYSTSDKELIKLFKKFAETETEIASLNSSLNELKDKSVTKENKLNAWQHIQSFLITSAKDIGTTGVNILKDYLENLL